MINQSLLIRTARMIRDVPIIDTIAPLEVPEGVPGCLAVHMWKAGLVTKPLAEKLQFAITGHDVFDITEDEWRRILHPVSNSTIISGQDHYKAIARLLDKYDLGHLL